MTDNPVTISSAAPHAMARELRGGASLSPYAIAGVLKIAAHDIDVLKAEVSRLGGENAELKAEINTPHTADFLEAVRLEAAHQRQRWGIEHDAGKADTDWFWLVGYLAGKAVSKPEKQLHHIITTAAACLNWHAARAGVDTRMQPGHAPSIALADSPAPADEESER